MNTILKTISYKNLSNWSVAHLLANDFDYNEEFPLVRIGNFLTRNKTRIEIEDETIYKRVTIRLYNKGVKLRNTEVGKNIGTKKQFLIKKGHFLLSKIDARNGAFGIANDEIDGAIITADFFAYDIDETKIDPLFLVLITTTEQFQKFAQSASSGTTGRQRIDETKFLDVKIPLPSLKRQKEILDSYKNKIKESKHQIDKVKDKEDEIENYFIDNLGLQFSDNANPEILNFTRLKSLISWSVKDILSKNSFKSSLFNVVPLSKAIIGKPQYGSNSKTVNKVTDVRYIRITDINDDGTLKDKVVSSEKVKETYLLKQDDFLLARSGTVGLSFLFDEKFGKCIYAGYLIRFNINKEILNPRFLLYYTKTKVYQNWVENTKRTTGVPNINAQEYLNSPIVLPSLKIQNEMLVHLEKLKKEVLKLNEKASSNKINAKKEFVKEIFN